MKRNIELFTVLSIVGSWTSIVAGGSDEIEMSEDNIVKIFDFSTASEDQLNNWWEVSDTVRYRNTFNSVSVPKLSSRPIVKLVKAPAPANCSWCLPSDVRPCYRRVSGWFIFIIL